MLTRICKELDFPAESITAIEQSYLSVTEHPTASVLFQSAREHLLHPNQVLFDEAVAQIIEITNLHPYTLNLLLCVSCIPQSGKCYEEAGLKESFEKHATSLRFKMISCKETFDIWGLTEGFWQWMFHEWQCVSLGRLEFEPFHHFRDIPYRGIRKGDPVILIHIPGGKPLDMAEVMESLRMAYLYFKDRFENETVPFITHSWLIYPPYLNGVFKEGGNLQRFAALFDIIDQNSKNYLNFSNIFGCPYPGDDLSGVPRETSLQRNMLQYIMQGNMMGQGYGIFLYGKNGIIKQS